MVSVLPMGCHCTIADLDQQADGRRMWITELHGEIIFATGAFSSVFASLFEDLCVGRKHLS